MAKLTSIVNRAQVCDSVKYSTDFNECLTRIDYNQVLSTKDGLRSRVEKGVPPFIRFPDQLYF
jgi:hypothetical protein